MVLDIFLEVLSIISLLKVVDFLFESHLLDVVVDVQEKKISVFFFKKLHKHDVILYFVCNHNVVRTCNGNVRTCNGNVRNKILCVNKSKGNCVDLACIVELLVCLKLVASVDCWPSLQNSCPKSAL